jgi:hypothetical protein
LPEDIRSATIPALRTVVESSISQIAQKKIERGFETRQAIVKKVLVIMEETHSRYISRGKRKMTKTSNIREEAGKKNFFCCL